ncbi:MAG: Gldg family protein, partial [Sphingopyxis sp.]
RARGWRWAILPLLGGGGAAVVLAIITARWGAVLPMVPILLAGLCAAIWLASAQAILRALDRWFAQPQSGDDADDGGAGHARGAARGWPLRLMRALMVPGLAVAGQWLGWALVLPPLYASAAASPRVRVAVMTALPMDMAGATPGAVLRGDAWQSPIMAMLRAQYAVRPVDAVDAALLAQSDVILLAHPAALPPQQLVAIDAWVRAGGAAVVLADPLSHWPPVHPLGDPRNPPITSLLTPLLAHWGLVLDAPQGLVPRMTQVVVDGQRLRLFSAGQWRLTGPQCAIVPVVPAAVHTVAECRIGRGRALLVADADWLHPAWRHPAPVGDPSSDPSAIGAASIGLSPVQWQAGNPAVLAGFINRMAPRAPRRAIAQPVWTQ